jgi:hypothetical protein
MGLINVKILSSMSDTFKAAVHRAPMNLLEAADADMACKIPILGKSVRMEISLLHPVGA